MSHHYSHHPTLLGKSSVLVTPLVAIAFGILMLWATTAEAAPLQTRDRPEFESVWLLAQSSSASQQGWELYKAGQYERAIASL
jgi:hypothetical protein